MKPGICTQYLRVNIKVVYVMKKCLNLNCQNLTEQSLTSDVKHISQPWVQ